MQEADHGHAEQSKERDQYASLDGVLRRAPGRPPVDAVLEITERRLQGARGFSANDASTAGFDRTLGQSVPAGLRGG